MGFAALKGHKYLSLETYKKSGEGVRTPVWFAEAPEPSGTGTKGGASGSPGGTAGRLYVYTIGNTGKVKRIRNNANVRVAPCTARGRPLGEWTAARATILTGGEAERGVTLLNKKYFPWKQVLDFFASFRPREHVVFAIDPV